MATTKIAAQEPQSEVPPRSVRISVSLVCNALIAVSLAIWLIGVGRIFLLQVVGTDTFLSDLSRLDLDSDLTVPSWYSSLLLAALALLTTLVGTASKADRPRDVKLWYALGVAFVLLSVDEAIAIHEMGLEPIRRTFDMPAIFTFGWIPFAILVIVGLAIVYIPFLLRLPRTLAVGMLISAFIYVFGVIGMGMINGAVFDALGFTKNFVFSLLSSVEEGLEIAGLTFLIIVLVKYLSRTEQVGFSLGR